MITATNSRRLMVNNIFIDLPRHAIVRRRTSKNSWASKMRTTALKKMMLGKATDPDDIAADLWKLRCWSPAEWLTKFFYKVVTEKKVPGSWQESTTIPIWKQKGSPVDGTNYRPIRLLSHSMKIFERIVDGRIRDIVQLSTNQSGFVAGSGTIDAIHAASVPVERNREKQKPLHLAFLDLRLEKAFDHVPREVIWYTLRQHGVPEELIEWVRILYSGPKSRVRAPAGTSAEFPISVGVHQGSALSPLLFNVVMMPFRETFSSLPPGRCCMQMT
ncbi:unnamed protein product [Heligmosomoides polygyrus]|uniref:Reverse transcriptase domain-containing protein n=1 Tax=Heligmosomoides polygyrus TaxID=6339 RepID=A0A183G3F8_HELPZ|nr:unnamed protein product [Heligmosomoides polygyrus]